VDMIFNSNLLSHTRYIQYPLLHALVQAVMTALAMSIPQVS
jgi:hypothetical protein